MDKYPCSCGGENPNCYRCDGTGMVKSMVLPVRSDGRIHPQPRNPETPTPPLRHTTPPKPAEPSIEKKWFCAKCKYSFLDPTEFIYHVRVEHPKSRVKQQQKINKPKGNAQQPPPISVTHQKKAQQTEDRADRGVTTLEVMRENQRLLEEARRALKHIRRSYPRAHMCESCFEIFKTDSELSAHNLKMHPPEPAAQPLIPKKKKKKKPAAKRQEQPVTQRDARLVPTRSESRARSSKPTINDTPREQDFRERRMDATYGMGGFARDHGQFGSASSYDSMDDESSP